MYADKLSMAHGLELRVPYLDKEIVEYVERLSASFKSETDPRNGCTAGVPELPPAVRPETPKRGFAVMSWTVVP